MQLLTYIYSALGIIGMVYTLIDRYRNKLKKENNINYQLIDINKTLKEHEEKDKDIKDSILKIEQEQDKQNISIAELHIKMDLICKASNVENEINKEDKKG